MTTGKANASLGLTKRGTPRKQGKSARGTWSRTVALDPRHRPQSLERPSSTVRRQWARAPQEAHLLDERNGRYRRLTVDEIAILQGFPPEWFDVPGVTDWNRTSAIGDAVPPPLARAVIESVLTSGHVATPASLEICAGAGGLASASATLGLEHAGLFEQWTPAVEILRSSKPWAPEVVHEADVRNINWTQFRDRIGLLSGGPPCQPWSTAGQRRRRSDDRDLLGDIHQMVADVRPEAFVFENVAGLLSASSLPYLERIMSDLRNPGDGSPPYGVVAGLFDAADFGVPQRRRRVFIIGMRERANADVYDIFDRIYETRSHRSPHFPDEARLPWVTVGQALSDREDPGGWRDWAHKDSEDRVGRSAAAN